MSIPAALAGYLESQADWRHQRFWNGPRHAREVEGRASIALRALAHWVRGLPENEPGLVILSELGCYVGQYDDEFWPGEEAAALTMAYSLHPAVAPAEWLDAFAEACRRDPIHPDERRPLDGGLSASAGCPQPNRPVM